MENLYLNDLPFDTDTVHESKLTLLIVVDKVKYNRFDLLDPLQGC